MSDPKILRTEVDGRDATAEQLRFPAFSYGHFTAMQVRGRKVRGLGPHLTRLDAANRELFGAGLDGDVVSDHIRHALGDMADASIRVYVSGNGRDDVSIMVTVRGPIDVTTEPIGIMSVPYQRSEPHIKHLGDHGQVYHRRRAELAGFDDALLTGPDGVISECGIANIAFFDGTSAVWPDAPALQGITMQLVEPRLADGAAVSPRTRQRERSGRVRSSVRHQRARDRSRRTDRRHDHERRHRPDANGGAGVRIGPVGPHLTMTRRLAVKVLRRSLPAILAVTVLSPQAPAGAASDPVTRNPGEPSYKVRLRGDAKGHVWHGEESITFTNLEAEPLTTIWLRLWSNGVKGCGARAIKVTAFEGGTAGELSRRCTALPVELNAPLAHGREGDHLDGRDDRPAGTERSVRLSRRSRASGDGIADARGP